MNQYSNNSNKLGLTTRAGKVKYDICVLSDGCDHPKCDTRRNYGIKVKKERTDYLMSSISVVTYSSTKHFCPKHRPDTPVTQDALNKEHEEAIKEWKEKKKQRNNNRYNRIVDSDIIPIFRYSNGRLYCKQSDCFCASNFKTIKDSVEFLKNSSIEVPVALISNQSNIFYIINLDGSVEKYSTKNKVIGFDEFEERFSGYEYSKRDLLSVRSNILTGTNYDKTPVRELEDIIDEVIEWHEYFKKNGHLEPYRCPACGSESIYHNDVNYSRLIIDGEEKIVPTHRKCNKIMGELNTDFIDKDSYELDN